MKSLLNLTGPIVKFIDENIPEPEPKEVLIKVVVSGCNPKDWKSPEYADAHVASGKNTPIDRHMASAKKGINQGDDIAGIVEKVGKDVIEFKVCVFKARENVKPVLMLMNV